MPGPSPVRARVRMYQVGFGDCFLLSFEYAQQLADGRQERHILIDFGAKPPPFPGYDLKPVAELIRAHCRGQLDAIVVTHRHEDHLGAFGKPDVAGVIDTLHPKLIVRPWTEDPKAEDRATGVTPASARFAAGLNLAQTALYTLMAQLETIGATARPDLRELAAAASAELANAAAIAQLEAWADGGKNGEYLHAGQKPRIEDHVPGVQVHVLGPPTIDQHKGVAKQRREDEDQFWIAARGLLLQGLAGPARKEQAGAREPAVGAAGVPAGPARTIAERLGARHLNMLLSVVRSMDNAMNNTSLVLLFEAGTKHLLFPGDAQIENWEYALSRPEDCALLRKVDLYKVGHHGSRNATPRGLFSLWNDGPQPRQMVALMSTKPGVHGKKEETRVPRRTLVAALNKRTKRRLFRTDKLPKSRLYLEVEGDLASDRPFREVAVP